jgi:hypothetical protein
MATTTPNFGWAVPTSTDLVKDGAVAIETLGDSIDASLVDLKGGTTGQVLAKASGTDMDFAWVAQDDSNAIQNAIVDAKGDLIGATAADTPARLAVGANNTSLVANSSAATGLEWQGAWTTWTPTFANLTVGNGTVTARYQQVGKTVNFEFRFVMGSTSSMGSTPNFTLPVSSALTPSYFVCFISDVGTGSFVGGADCNATNAYPFVTKTDSTYGGIGYLSATQPMTWVTGDNFVIRGTYEAA